MDQVSKVLVVGGGSAGFLTALALKHHVPGIQVSLVHSSAIPIIGVGESTTIAFPRFVHQYLGIDRGEFFEMVQPSWKLGIRFEWGDPERSHFNYTFDGQMGNRRQMLSRIDSFYCLHDDTHASTQACLMDRQLSPCFGRSGRYTMTQNYGYHLDARLLVKYLEQRAVEQGIELIDGTVADIQRHNSGNVSSVNLEDGRRLTADLFVDCTGFRSLLLSKTMGAPFVSYADELFCDRAWAGRAERDGEILPYTTTSTMDHGWSWRIEFENHITRGYVFSSEFCSDDQAAHELMARSPEIGTDLRLIKFPRGRYEKFWVGNVAAIGNASGFVEPLEATALHMVAEQVRGLCQSLVDCNNRIVPAMQELQNRRYRTLWDDICAFLAVHYKFNHHRDTPFWKHCQKETDLTCAADFVEAFQQAGPSIWLSKLLPDSIFGFSGYMCMLIGQNVPTRFDK
ncbi:MAG: tryptophan halogenase family protein, partial [Pirellulaceae bacterium]